VITPGVGKTMIAVALAVAACQAGFSIYFTTLDDLVRKLRAAEATGRFNRQLGVYLRPAVLVCDEVGYLPLEVASDLIPPSIAAAPRLRGCG
jgi:DNA replication protein DnaC